MGACCNDRADDISETIILHTYPSFWILFEITDQGVGKGVRLLDSDQILQENGDWPKSRPTAKIITHDF